MSRATQRTASHAGSWYTGTESKLDSELDGWLAKVPSPKEVVTGVPPKAARIIIAPHAGYSYSGPAAAWAYKNLDLANIKRVFILGPSHHIYLDGCALTTHSTYATPLGALTIDTSTTSALHKTGKFTYMSTSTDEDEHSIEMHLPYTYKMLSLHFGDDPKIHPPIVPILVGSISTTSEKTFGELLAPYIADKENAFIISSDFCHWGTRFSYTHYCGSSGVPTSLTRSSRLKPGDIPIYESIEKLDRAGMEAIETGKHDAFAGYLKETGNTICGRHPIGVVMAALEKLGEEGGGKFQFVRYERSSEVVEVRDSSVSYASAFAVV